jgi:hypothetical protein
VARGINSVPVAFHASQRERHLLVGTFWTAPRALDLNETRVCRGDDVSRGDVCELGGGEDREAKGVQQCKDKEEGGKAIHQSRRGLSKAWKGHDKRDQRSYEDEGPLKVNM